MQEITERLSVLTWLFDHIEGFGAIFPSFQLPTDVKDHAARCRLVLQVVGRGVAWLVDR